MQAEVRPTDHPQTALPKNMRTMNEGIQNPVLTFTKAAAASDEPTMQPTMGMPAWKPHAAAIIMIVARAQAKRRRTP